jgi:hypothetical protein
MHDKVKAMADVTPDVYDLNSESDRAFFLLNTHYDQILARELLQQASEEEKQERARFEMALEKANTLRAKLALYKLGLNGTPADLEFMFEVAEVIENLETMTTSDAYSLTAGNPNAYTQALLELEQGSKIVLPVAPDLKSVFSRPPTIESASQAVASRFELLKFVLHINVRKMSQSVKNLGIKLIAETDPSQLIPDHRPSLRAEAAARE